MKIIGYALLLILTGCVFGSIANFSEDDIKNNENEIYNSGFESISTEAEMEGWTVLEDYSSVLSLVNDDFHTGKISLKISHPKERISIISDSFPIDPDAVYFSRCYVKSNYKSNLPVRLHFVVFDAAGKQLNTFQKKGYPDNVWSDISLNAGFFKPAARFARVFVSLPAREDKIFWLDDVESFKVYKIQK
ncbi:MAG TPA: hypothetical protein PLD62_03245 [Candidatus Cloacimonadota bacterium]|nr:hypothetical protein [Candidatus Cloacimonadota bacterium]